MEMANELNMANFQAVLPVMAEYATASSTNGVQVGGANMLADVYSTATDHQYSVKTYKDKSVMDFMVHNMEEPKYTEFIIERRVAGVGDPNSDPELVMTDVISDILLNESNSKNYYNVNNTSSVLLGYYSDEDYFYFRLSEFEYVYKFPHSCEEKQFTEKSKNYNKHIGNRSCVVGYDENGTSIYEWVHPNNQTYTRCLKKKYDLSESDSFYFKIKKQKYNRPSNEELMEMIEL